MKYGDLEDAVKEASPRILEVNDLSRSRNGFGWSLSVGMVVDSGAAFTADELDVVAEAIWRSLPWEPSSVRIIAAAETPGGEPVDLRAAASNFSPPLVVRPFGHSGVSLGDLELRYGEWTAP